MRTRHAWVRGAALAALGLALGACATPSREPLAFDLFAPAPSGDVWSPRIRAWQAAVRLDAVTAPSRDVASGVGGAPLALALRGFERELRMATVSRALAWVQAQAGFYYQPDGRYDHWPTLRELLEVGRDDCDGFDLLTLELLRSLGFRERELYRAILRNADNGLHHMVTLWFPEPGARDPIVLDPTAYITRAAVPLSRLQPWVPLALFDETQQYRARPLTPDRSGPPGE